MEGEFSVWQFFADDTHVFDVQGVSAEKAVERFDALTTSVGAKVGTTERVIITDAGDCTTAEWQHGKGLLVPRK
jgi:hypothetical protein